jgi:glutaminyl-peptide cyclotransferase
VLLDFVGDRELAIPYEGNSSPRLWRRLRSAARRAGASGFFPDTSQGAVSDDHIPFIRRGVPSIDLIDFDFPCWHRRCDDMSVVSPRSVNAVGETVLRLVLDL